MIFFCFFLGQKKREKKRPEKSPFSTPMLNNLDKKDPIKTRPTVSDGSRISDMEAENIGEQKRKD